MVYEVPKTALVIQFGPLSSESFLHEMKLIIINNRVANDISFHLGLKFY